MSKKPMIVDTALRNTLQLLQQEPRRYKLFGIYWWPMKDTTKRLDPLSGQRVSSLKSA
jgi:hypothetical protein